jgi:uncharacterized membrane protein YgdD (TMEM256/DUF423 family)
MSILKDVILELVGMFIADARLTAAILALVALTAVLTDLIAASTPLLGGTVLLAGCLGLVIESVRRAARAQRR